MADSKYPNKIPGLSDEDIDANEARGKAMGADGSEAQGQSNPYREGYAKASPYMRKAIDDQLDAITSGKKKPVAAKPKTRLRDMQP